MKKILLLLPLLILLYSCPNGGSNNDTLIPETPNPPAEGEPQIVVQDNTIWYFFNFSTDNEFAYGLMDEMYLWHEDLPALTRDVNSYTEPQHIFNELKNEKDDWSFILTLEDYNGWINGESKGYGLSFDVLEVGSNDYEIRITTLQQDSDFYKQGVRRGDEILSIDGYTVSQLLADVDLVDTIWNANSAEFVINRSQGGEITLDIAKRTIKSTTVDKRAILTGTNETTGYLSFNGFVYSQQSELDEAFEYFENHEIKDLIIDLRYNGGGDVVVATHLVSILVGNKQTGKVSTTLTYNDLYSGWNTTEYIKDAGFDFNFDKIYFLTNHNTASASEMVMNSLAPFIDTVVIGENSYGKPVGMNGLSYNGSNYMYFPITFKYDNANGVSDFYDGIPVDFAVNDTISYDYGDENDPLISAAIYHINNGSFQTGSRSLTGVKRTDTFKLKGFNRLRGFF